MRVLVTIALMALGMSAWGQTRGFINPCTGEEISHDDQSLRPCLTDLQRTLDNWATLNPGVRKPSGKAKAKDVVGRLQAGHYYVGNDIVVFNAKDLRKYGPCALHALYGGDTTAIRRFKCELDFIPTVLKLINIQRRELNCWDMPAVWARNENTVTVTVCGKVFRYDVTVPDCPCTEVSTERVEICEGRDTLWRGQRLKVANTYRDSVPADSVGGCAKLYILNLDVVPMVRSEEQRTIARGDSTEFDKKWLTIGGVYKSTAKSQSACDTVKTLFLTVNNPCNCKDDHQKWLALGPVAVQLYTGFDGLPFGWQRSVLMGGGLLGEYKFKKGLLFPKNLCWGEALRLQMMIRSANTPFVRPGGCLTCQNIPVADKRLLELGLMYQAYWLKGWPYTVGMGVGPVMRYQRVEGQKALLFGARLNSEAEWHFAKKLSVFAGPTLDWYGHYRLVPSLWAGVRFWPISPKSKKKRK